MRFAVSLVALTLAASGLCPAQNTITDKTAGMLSIPGYFPLYYDAKTGRLLLEVNRWNVDFLYVNSLPYGVGSNDIGLDRGQLGGTMVVHFERRGPKAMLVQPNQDYRAITQDAEERRAVEQSFAQSILWGFNVEAEEGTRALVDATAFFLHDVHGIPETLARENQGAYTLDGGRSALYLDRTKNFPRNTEVEAILTFAGSKPGPWVSSVTPSPESLTVHERHSFVALPEQPFQPRAYDVRAGMFGIQYMDFATPIAEPIVKRFITRHRLPLTYYVDSAAPEPIRSALLEGARWWSQAFAAAGFPNAWKVEVLPAGADPMDVRYNVIQWVHRSTRGWSYGGGVVDPRTGEILKGQVTLGSLRVRQDFLIAEGLIAKYEEGRPVDPRMEQMALARLRQLAAHEVGHALGLQHNFAASAHDRASVMDYPPPVVKLDASGEIDLNGAYATGIGEWDKIAIRYGYSEGVPLESVLPLESILKEARDKGIPYITDRDARAAGGANPIAHLWDAGPNAVDELNRVMKVRAKALAGFSEEKIRVGFPMSTLEEVLVPVYLFHRYQLEAAAKSVGGLDYTYAVRGDGQTVAEIVPAAEQRRALEALMGTLDAGALTVPESVLRLLPPHPPGYEATREDFHSRTQITFDSMAPVEAAADMTVAMLLNPERATRLVEYHARNAKNPGLDEVIDRLLAATWKAPPTADARLAETARSVDNVVLYRLMLLASDAGALEQARAIAFLKLDDLRKYLLAKTGGDAGLRAHCLFAATQIKRFQDDPKQIGVGKPAEAPDGPPI